MDWSKLASHENFRSGIAVTHLTGSHQGLVFLCYFYYFSFFLDGVGVLDGGAAAGSWLSVTDLQPYTNYSFWIRGCNTQGCVESLPLSVTTPPAGTHAPWAKAPNKRSQKYVSCTLIHISKPKNYNFCPKQSFLSTSVSQVKKWVIALINKRNEDATVSSV